MARYRLKPVPGGWLLQRKGWFTWRTLPNHAPANRSLGGSYTPSTGPVHYPQLPEAVKRLDELMEADRAARREREKTKKRGTYHFRS